MKMILNISLFLFFIGMVQITWSQVGLSVEEGTNVTLSNGSGYFLVGSESTNNLIFDNNEIQSRTGGHPTSLLFNFRGGDVFVGSSVGQSNLLVADYTRLGNSAPAIQTILITGTTSSATTILPHTLPDQTKIISISIVVEADLSGSPFFEHYAVDWHDQGQVKATTTIPNGSDYKMYITYMQ